MKILKQSTQVTLTIGPLIDDTDFKTLETAVAYNAAGIDVDVIKEGGTKADITLASGAGDGYWAHNAQGQYKLTLSTTDTGTLGHLRVLGYATGVLPWWEDYEVVPANVYDALVAGSDLLAVDSQEISSDSAAADALELFIEALGTDDKVLISTDAQDLSATLDVNTKTLTAGVVNAAAIATDAIDADAIKADAGTEIGTAVWAAATRALTDKVGFKLAADGLDTVSTTEPSGVASNFREMIVQTWRRFFSKTTLTGSQFKCYTASGGVATLQAANDDGTTQTVGDAS